MNILWRSSVAVDDIDRDLLPEGSHVEVVTDRAEARERIGWADVLVDGRPDDALLDGERLERVIVPYAGVAPEVQERLRKRPHLKLHNSHFNAPFVAQHAVALLLAVANRIAEGHASLQRGDWRPRYDDDFTSLDLQGKRCLLVGYGAIGQEIAGRVRGLGMEVAAVRRTVPADPDVPTRPPEELVAAMAEADVAMVSVPLTDETERWIDRDALDALGPDGIVVNVGRGEVIDQDALYDAVRERTLFGAGIDVWWTYPDEPEQRSMTYPSRRPLHTVPTIVMSPHRANQVQTWGAASFADVAKTLREAAAGRERNRVDPVRGY